MLKKIIVLLTLTIINMQAADALARFATRAGVSAEATLAAAKELGLNLKEFGTYPKKVLKQLEINAKSKYIIAQKADQRKAGKAKSDEARDRQRHAELGCKTRRK